MSDSEEEEEDHSGDEEVEEEHEPDEEEGEEDEGGMGGGEDDDGPMPEQASPGGPGHRHRERQKKHAHGHEHEHEHEHHGKHGHAHMPKAHATLNRRASNAHHHELEDEERQKRALLDMLDPKKRREAELRYKYVVARFVGGGWWVVGEDRAQVLTGTHPIPPHNPLPTRFSLSITTREMYSMVDIDRMPNLSGFWDTYRAKPVKVSYGHRPPPATC
jgi:hypothetical protein